MALDDDIRIMRQVDLFEGFTGEQLRLLAFGSEMITVGAGKQLYIEGDSADCAFIVVDGEVDILHTKDGQSVSITKARPGSILGELALIADTRRLTDAVVSQQASLLRLNRSTFRRILVEYPDVAVSLHARISQNLKKMLDQIAGLKPHFTD